MKWATSFETFGKINVMRFFIISMVVILCIWFIFWVLAAYHGGTESMFDSLAALFNAFAFVGMIVTILLQREELTSQREEMARSASAAEKNLYFQNLLFFLEKNKSTYDEYIEYVREYNDVHDTENIIRYGKADIYQKIKFIEEDCASHVNDILDENGKEIYDMKKIECKKLLEKCRFIKEYEMYEKEFQKNLYDMYIKYN